MFHVKSCTFTLGMYPGFAENAAGLCRVAALQALGFEFDEAAAEWGRWFRETAAAAGESSSPAYGSSEALLLTNWCGLGAEHNVPNVRQ